MATTTTPSPAEVRGDHASAGLLIRMSLEQRELVHAVARQLGLTTRSYLLSLIDDDLRRRRARETASEAVANL